ncbi:vWA domain-containing protein [Crocosphaera sp. XPORK-15E]|uniref:vWA domain-containing protein n=1 Tax=Crocosphaera sp. XPORK-15E TaxID=3110247 RepID=UPI002B1F897D|nr:vWA domain-containing protein [Crocosphaera sp. XPORK-15E]MEA5535238.1 vWA domain-containing protein [Crocosphaera sp. XPORK-15E]
MKSKNQLFERSNLLYKKITNSFRQSFRAWFLVGICLTLLWGCLAGVPKADSFDSAYESLQNKVIPKISTQNNIVPDELALRYAIDNTTEPLPPIDKYPIYGAQPTQDPNIIYLEIFGSPEKANAQKEDERWFVDVIEKFNQQKNKTSSGKIIQVGVRNIPSGIGQQMIAAKVVKPAGYTPSHDLWIQMLKGQGIQPVYINKALLPSNPGIVLNDQVKQELFGNKEVTFDDILDAILAEKITIGYTNPYASSTGLNLLYTIFWRAAGHDKDGKPLTIADLQSSQVNSIFTGFQKQVLLTALTTIDLKEIFLRDPKKLPAFAIDDLSYHTLKQLPEFAKTSYIPFGVPHNSPLVGFSWNTPEQEEGLKKLAQFATSETMQKLAPPQSKEVTEYLQKNKFPPLPSGEVLTRGQAFWKQQKDAGKTVYLMAVIDTSGSMEGEPLNAVKEGLKIASKEINAGNYIGLVTYGDTPNELVPLAPFDELQHKRFLAAIDNLRADGATAMYDGVMVALSKLMEQKKANPDGRFYLLLLTDGAVNTGFNFNDISSIIEYSGVRVYPIAYGEVNEQELQSIAALRESTVKKGNPENVKDLLKELFQTNL